MAGVDACPLCDEHTIVERESRPAAKKYRCFSCGHVFPTPRRRPPKRKDGKPSLAGVLEMMDPDDLGGGTA